jgi:hypothetical protein
MNTDRARDDLAFLRGLVQPDERWQRGFGESYAAAGLCYGTQMIGHGLQGLGIIPGDGPFGLLIGAGPTVVFVVLLLIINRRNRMPPRATGGVTSRAVGAVFSAVGTANFFLIAIFAALALREHSLKIWLLYPCVVLIMQGAAWMVAYALRRQRWFAVVAAGWFLTGLAMGLTIETIGWYILIGGVGLFAFMLVPGLVMMRQAKAAA